MQELGDKVVHSVSVSKDHVAARAQVEGVDRLLRLPEVLGIVPIGKTMIYRRGRAGTFPKPCKLGMTTLWSEREVADWFEEVPASRGE